MNKALYFVVGIGIIGGLVRADGESLLKAAAFPKTFNDAPFITRMQVLADDYINFETVYGADGRCISGCAYPGITLEEETEAMQRRTELANSTLESHGQYSQPQPTITNSQPTPSGADVVPQQNTQPQESNNQQTQQHQQTQTSQPTTHPNQQTQPSSSVLAQTCRATYLVKQTGVPWNSPIDGKIIITSDFGPRKAPVENASTMHRGIDIRATTGTNVYATAGGTIEYIRDQGNSGGGKYVVVKHDNGNFRTAYFHLSNNTVRKVGDRVQAGDLIGISGNTGNSSGPHLHYEIYYTQSGKIFGWGQDAIDPLWTKNYLDTQYSFKSQTVKSCLHNPNNFCGDNSAASNKKTTETLPCEVK